MKASLVLLTALFIASAHQTLLGESSGDWTYSVADGQATITGYSGDGGAVAIPAAVNEISVVKLGDGSPPIFGNGNTTVTSITIPDSVTSIGGDAFYGCTSLTSVSLPILFSDSYPSFSLSSEQVLLYGSPVARDVPLSNNFTAGKNDVTNSPASYDLYTAGDVSTAEAASRILGQQDVTVSPSAYDLHTSTELAEATAAARTIVNVSARVDLGESEIVTPGFVVLGEQKKLLIRAVGPKLADLGVGSPLPNPTMTDYKTRYDGNPPDVVATIDDWKTDNDNVSEIVSAMSSAGAFPLEPTETFQGRPFMTDDTSSAATLVTLDIGVYTVQVSSADDGAGEVLVEVYEITD